MPPKRKSEAGDVSSAPSTTPPAKRRSIFDAMEKYPPTPEAGHFKIKCVEGAVAFMALDPVPTRASLHGKVLWTEQRKEDMAVVFLAQRDDCSDIGDHLWVIRDATQEIKTKNMKFLLCSSVYGAQDAAQQFSVGRLVHCKRTTGHGSFNFCGYSCSPDISQWTFDISDN
ncbi:hypothetical protein LEN26_012090 [Aphanomyces euteiches]|nr:hypothetical protein AeMF1_014875 [Aphanomyces euteiches]KAH9118451.1 hypothetical protein LEN26_012090 [Aphanomyces euteiches]KAH9181154.1 hypothetical protein AeNC1_016870 [Aphanomyces euteiches]